MASRATFTVGVIVLPTHDAADEIYARLNRLDGRCARRYGEYILTASTNFGAAPAVVQAIVDFGRDLLLVLSHEGSEAALSLLDDEMLALSSPVEDAPADAASSRRPMRPAASGSTKADNRQIRYNIGRANCRWDGRGNVGQGGSPREFATAIKWCQSNQSRNVGCACQASAVHALVAVLKQTNYRINAYCPKS